SVRVGAVRAGTPRVPAGTIAASRRDELRARARGLCSRGTAGPGVSQDPGRPTSFPPFMLFDVLRLLAVSVLVLATRLSAAAPVLAPHVSVDLLADAAAVAPGGELSIGVRFVLEDGWH